MRKMSLRRRRLAAMSSSMACLSAVMPSLVRHHPRMEWAWLAIFVPLMVWMLVLMVRLRADEGCA